MSEAPPGRGRPRYCSSSGGAAGPGPAGVHPAAFDNGMVDAVVQPLSLGFLV